MLLRQLSYAIKNQLKANKALYQGLKDKMPPTRHISCPTLVHYGITGAYYRSFLCMEAILMP